MCQDKEFRKKQLRIIIGQTIKNELWFSNNLHSTLFNHKSVIESIASKCCKTEMVHVLLSIRIYSQTWASIKFRVKIRLGKINHTLVECNTKVLKEFATRNVSLDDAENLLDKKQK